MATLDVDIGDGCKEIESPQQDLPEGHTVKDVIENANPFSDEESRYFDRKVTFGCPEMPTSFHFRITFPRYHEVDISSIATVRRTDGGADMVNLTLVVMVCGDGGREVMGCYPITDLIKGPPKWINARYTIEQMEWFLQEDSNARLEFSVTVLNCHKEQKGAKAGATPHSQDSSSKERRCVQSSS